MGDSRLPFLLLAAYWRRKDRSQGDLYALRLAMDDDHAMRDWVGATEVRSLLRLAYEHIAAGIKR